MKLRTFLTSAVAAAAALAFSTPALAQTNYKSEYRMSLVLGTAFPWGKGGELWANKVRERTEGRINIKLYPGVSLIQGDQTREFSALRQGVIDPITRAIVNSGLGEYGVLSLLIALLLVLGMFLDGISIFLIFVPLLMPIMDHYQWSPVWFGVVLTLNVAIGQFTPPMAVNLMVSSRIANVRMEETTRWVLWLVAGMSVALLLVIVWPQLALWLPERLGY